VEVQRLIELDKRLAYAGKQDFTSKKESSKVCSGWLYNINNNNINTEIFACHGQAKCLKQRNGSRWGKEWVS
jgi:hypothetical protein